MVGGMLCCVSPFIVSSIVPGRYVAHSPSKDTRTAATKQALAEVAPLLRLMVDRGIDEQPEAGHLGSVDALGRLLEDALARMSLLEQLAELDSDEENNDAVASSDALRTSRASCGCRPSTTSATGRTCVACSSRAPRSPSARATGRWHENI